MNDVISQRFQIVFRCRISFVLNCDVSIIPNSLIFFFIAAFGVLITCNFDQYLCMYALAKSSFNTWITVMIETDIQVQIICFRE